MQPYTLVIGNKNYSSWSMRPWVAMRHAGVEFAEEVIPLDLPDTAGRLAAYRDAPPRVPVLRVGDFEIWDSLAILEFINERHPDAGLLPADPLARARARSVSAEMHSGFAALRGEVPMNVRKRRAIVPGAAAKRDIARIEGIWASCLEAGGGPFLFGGFGIADAMFAPVVMRLVSIDWDLRGASRGYVDAVLENAAVAQWMADAGREPWVIDSAE